MVLFVIVLNCLLYIDNVYEVYVCIFNIYVMYVYVRISACVCCFSSVHFCSVVGRLSMF